MKRYIKAIMPNKLLKKIQIIKNEMNLLLNCYYDYKKFSKYHVINAKTENATKSGLESWILQDKHRLEKGFSLPNPRYGFGKDVIIRLVNNLEIYKASYGKTEVYFIGVGAIKSYGLFHYENKDKIFDGFNKTVESLRSDFNNKECELSGYIEGNSISKSKLELEDFNEFLKSRVSCRNFDKNKTISNELLDNIVEACMYTPSVCNRQHWKVHFFSNEKKNLVLSFQNGNTGFTDNIPMIAVISSDLSAFYMASERNQPFTDSGLFSMNLLLAMNAAGLDSCALNWCLSSKNESKFMELGLIPKNELVSVIIAFGYRNEDCKKAKSPRINHKLVYHIHE